MSEPLQQLAENVAEFEKIDFELIELRQQLVAIRDKIKEKEAKHTALEKAIAKEVQEIDCSQIGNYGWDRRVPQMLALLRRQWKPKPPPKRVRKSRAQEIVDTVKEAMANPLEGRDKQVAAEQAALNTIMGRTQSTNRTMHDQP